MKKMILIAASVMAINFAFSQNSKEEQSIRNSITLMENGWNLKSGEVFSSSFADVHDYVVVNGLYFPKFTKQANATVHQGLFDGIYKTRDVQLKIDKIAFLHPELVLVHAFGATYEKGGPLPKDPSAIMTLLLQKQKNDWRIISFHNHGIDMEDVKERGPMPLNVMYASWYKN